MKSFEARTVLATTFAVMLATLAPAGQFASNATIRFFPCAGQRVGVFVAPSGSSNVSLAFSYVPDGSPELPEDTTLTGASIAVDGGELSVWDDEDALVLDLHVVGTADSATAFDDDGGLALLVREPASGSHFGAIDQSSPCNEATDPIGGGGPCETTTCASGGCGASSCTYACGNSTACGITCKAGFFPCCNCVGTQASCKCH